MNSNHEILISIIVISYNSGKYILDLLDSIKEQSYKNIELIISDDCSGDNSIRIAKEWISKNRARFINVKIVESPVNTGVSANCNRGCEVASGKYIKTIAADDLLAKNYVSKMVEGLETENADIAFCYEYVFYDKEKNKIKTEYDKKLEIRPKAIGFFKCSPESMYKRLLQANILPAPTAMIKKTVLNELGGFDEDYAFIEDYPLWLKAIKSGKKLIFVENYGVYYRKTENSASWRESKELNCAQIKFQNDISNFVKNVRNPELKRLGIDVNTNMGKPLELRPWDRKIRNLKEAAYNSGYPRMIRIAIIFLSPRLTKITFCKKFSIIKNIAIRLKRKLNIYPKIIEKIQIYTQKTPTNIIKRNINYKLRRWDFDNVVPFGNEEYDKGLGKELYQYSRKCEKKYQNRKNNDRITICFAVHLFTAFSSIESIFLCAEKHKDINAILLVIPWRQPGMDKSWNYDKEFIKYLKNKGYKYQLGYNNKKWIHILEFNPDVVFYQTPYDKQRNPVHNLLKVKYKPKLMYTPYGPWVMDKSVKTYIDAGINKEFFNECWKAFFDKLTYEMMEYAAPEYVQKCIITGTPKVDYIWKGTGISDKYCWKESTGKKVIWLPRWGVEEDRTSFLDYYKYFLNIIDNEKINFVMRPHPLLWKDLKKSQVMSEEEIKYVFNKFNNKENSFIDNGCYDYREGLLSCDFIIADFTSVIYEYLPTMKPIIYTPKDNTLINRKIMDVCYIVRDNDEMKAVIENLLQGKDPMKEKRKLLVDELNYFPDEKCNGESILECIINSI